MDLGLRDRVYLVTGGSRGLGFAAAQALVADGARIVLSAPHEATASSAAARLTRNAAAGHPVAWVVADNADPATPGRLIGAARDRFGRLDGALISVGGSPPGTIATTTDDAWRSAFESVFLGAVRLARILAADLGGTDDGAAEAGSVTGAGGSIVFVLASSVRVPLARRSRRGARPPVRAHPAAQVRRARGVRPSRRVPALPSRVLHHGRDDPGRRRCHQLDLGSEKKRGQLGRGRPGLWNDRRHAGEGRDIDRCTRPDAMVRPGGHDGQMAVQHADVWPHILWTPGRKVHGHLVDHPYTRRFTHPRSGKESHVYRTGSGATARASAGAEPVPLLRWRAVVLPDGGLGGEGGAGAGRRRVLVLGHLRRW